jgi:hypothetical protein
MAVTGAAKMIPTNPATIPPRMVATRITRGWSWRREPTAKGVTRFSMTAFGEDHEGQDPQGQRDAALAEREQESKRSGDKRSQVRGCTT